MATTKAMTGAGATLTIGGVAIGQLKTFQFSGAKWAQDDITNSTSPISGVGVLKEVIQTVVDYGEMSLMGVWLYNDAGQVALTTAFNAGTTSAFVLTLAKGEGQTVAGATFTFTAYVTDLPFPDISFDKALTFKSSLKINSLVATTSGS